MNPLDDMIGEAIGCRDGGSGLRHATFSLSIVRAIGLMPFAAFGFVDGRGVRGARSGDPKTGLA